MTEKQRIFFDRKTLYNSFRIFFFKKRDFLSFDRKRKDNIFRNLNFIKHTLFKHKILTENKGYLTVINI